MVNHITLDDSGHKVARVVTTEEEYRALRSSPRNKKLLALARGGDDSAKRQLVQFCYSCAPTQSPLPSHPDIIPVQTVWGDGAPLKGCTLVANSVGMDVDIHRDEDEDERDYQKRLEAIPKKIMAKKDELGLLMLERSVSKGYHIVFRRRTDLGQVENLEWASQLLGVPFDAAAKDVTRVFFTTSADTEDLLYLDAELFDTTLPEMKVAEPAPVVHQVPTTGESQGEKELPYHLIIPAFFQMECPSYPQVPEGTRNDTLFNVTAKYLRYCTDHNYNRLLTLLYPHYSFGLSEAEVGSIIRSALSRERALTPKAVRYVLKKFGNEPDKSSSVLVTDEDEGAPYRQLSDCIIDETLLPPLPRWVNVALKVAPAGYKFNTLASLAPAIMTLLTDITCRFAQKKVSRLNAWTHVDGPPACNKSICLQPIPVLMKPLQDEDDRNQARENEYYEKLDEAVNKEQQPKKPKDIVIRILPPNTTRLEHIKRMYEAGGKQTYTYAEEIQSLDLGTRGTYHNRGDFMQLLFDNGMTGNQSMHGKSIRCRTEVRWNLSTSGTRDQTVRTFSNVTNGAVTRVFFCLMPDNRKNQMPDYVQYTDNDVEYLHRAARVLMQMNGHVGTPRLDKALLAWLEKVRLESLDDYERLTFKNRSADIAHKFGVTMHLCWVVQQIMDTEDREQRTIEVRDLDLSQYAEKKASIDMALYAADQCLDGQYRLWAKKMKQQLEAAYEGTAVFRKSDKQYLEIPDTFTYSTLHILIPDKKASAMRKMVERWKKANVVVEADERDGEKLFRKVGSIE